MYVCPNMTSYWRYRSDMRHNAYVVVADFIVGPSEAQFFIRGYTKNHYIKLFTWVLFLGFKICNGIVIIEP